MTPEQVEALSARLVTLNENITLMSAHLNEVHTELTRLTQELHNHARIANLAILKDAAP